MQLFDEEEAHEIQEEDQSLIKEFETLLPLAQHEWEQSSKSFSRFWSDFHREMVSTYVNEPDIIYAQGVVDAGVRIEEDDEPGTSGEDEESGTSEDDKSGATDLLSSSLEYWADMGEGESINEVDDDSAKGSSVGNDFEDDEHFLRSVIFMRTRPEVGFL
ncbi:MAG: hypothetical protein Q9181_007601 [Wetmoreana brouardii]